MPTFTWEGRTQAGELRRGTMEAETAPAVAMRLRAQGIVLRRAEPKSRELGLRLARVKAEEIVVFTRQFATMLDAGLPIVQCLDILAGQTTHRVFARVLGEVKGAVESGSTLADALRRQRAFDALYVNLVQAGEVSGALDTILGRLSSYIEKSLALRRQVKGALVYPVAILAVALGVVTLLLWKVIPIFATMFRDFGGATLPRPTQIVIDLSNGFIEHAPLLFGLLLVAVLGSLSALRTRRGRTLFDRAALRLPLMGSLLRKVVVARFCRTLGTLLSSGVAILDALEIVAKTAGNLVVEKAILYTRDQIAEGKPLVEPLAAAKVFPDMVVQMIGVGEQTGALDTMLQKIADFYEAEVDVAVSALTKLMEPLMMVFLGFLVGGIIIAMYLPIFEMAGQIKAG